MGDTIRFLKNQQKIIKFVKKNPNATYRLIRNKIRLNPNRYFDGGMEEIFDKAGIKPPRTFKRRNKYERQNIIIEYLKKNPCAGGHTIARETKINLDNTFKNIQEAYAVAGIEYPRKKSYWLSPDEKRKIIVKSIRENPYLTLQELVNKIGVKNIYRLFQNMEEIYELAGVRKVSQGEKILNRKRNNVINFIRMNPSATQMEINNACKTHVQYLFKKGIFDAYLMAGIKYPFEERKLFGTALIEIKKRAKDFEKEISEKLVKYGSVNRYVKTRRGVADIVLERKNKKIVIEIKDYQQKEISISQVKQLNKYLEDLNCRVGLLICHKKSKKDKFIIGKNKIFILEKQELNKILEIT